MIRMHSIQLLWGLIEGKEASVTAVETIRLGPIGRLKSNGGEGNDITGPYIFFTEGL
jgi:hypothetical protein